MQSTLRQVITRDKPDDTLNQFLNSISNRKEIVVLGDFNAHVWSKKNDYTVGSYGAGKVNDNGED